MNLGLLESEFQAAKPVYKTIAPGPMSALKLTGRAALAMKFAGGVYTGFKMSHEHAKGKPWAQIMGEKIGGKVIGKVMSPVSKRVKTAHLEATYIQRDRRRKNGLGGRSWIRTPGRQEMIIIFHDANRAGPHVDVHIGRFSMIYRVKPDVYSQLRYNPNGMLTENSRKLLMDFVRDEIERGARVPQNLDHSRRNARASWTNGDPLGRNYGDGRTRQIVSLSEVDVYKTGPDQPIHLYAPVLNPHRSTYIHRLYNGDGKRAPILIWGMYKPKVPAFEERLHLKMIDPDEIEKLLAKADPTTSTFKYDGSSCYWIVDSKGFRAYSPRLSKETGEQIEYTFKLDGMATMTSDEPIMGMGEVMFMRKHWFWSGIWTDMLGLGAREGVYLSQSEGAGLLNSHALLPDSVEPRIFIYRVDKVGRAKTVDLPFWENRAIQIDTVLNRVKGNKGHGGYVWSQGKWHRHWYNLDVVALGDPDLARELGFEGVVMVSEGASVNSGFKTKWWQDANDWVIETIEFRPGDNGGIAGVMWCRSLESDKVFKMGPGQTGDHALVNDMMNRPDAYEGAVVKVRSRHGHEGRAAKVLAFHDDKGYAAPTLEQVAA